jgi:hypothetical protein
MYNGKRITQKSLGDYSEISLKKAMELREKYIKMELENIPSQCLINPLKNNIY